jgi:hypothetical protein
MIKLKDEILELQKINSYPSVSILMPTHRTFPDNKQDSIRLRNLAAVARKRLVKEFDKKESEKILSSIDKKIEEIDFNYAKDGLAIFANNETTRLFEFPFPVQERVIIDKTFATRDLVFAYNRSQPYYVVVINDKYTKIYTGIRENLTEVKHPSLPVANFIHENKDGMEDVSYNDRVVENEQRLKNFYREADDILKQLIGTEQIPFIITGTPRQTSMYRDITRLGHNLFGEVHGSYENSSEAELAKLAWPVAKESFAEKRKLILEEVEKAIKAKKFASGIDEVWKLAAEGRAQVLLTEINFSYPAVLSEAGQLAASDKLNGSSGTKGEVIEDAVDEIIESVVSKGGRAVFFDNGKLAEFGKIAMILRY